MRLEDVYREGVRRLQDCRFKKHFVSEERASRQLICDVLNLSLTTFTQALHKDVSLSDYELILQKIKRLSSGEPFAYVIGHTLFMETEFLIDSSVLIPRPETEYLCEYILSRHSNKTIERRGIEIGIGSACITVSLLKARPLWKMIATDISKKALFLAKKNIQRHNVGNRVVLCQADILKGIRSQPVDFLVSNPPYIKTSDLKKLDSWVKDYEPHWALDGGENGMECIFKILREGIPLLKPQGTLYMEIGDNQSAILKEFLEDFEGEFECKSDIFGHDRYIIFTKR